MQKIASVIFIVCASAVVILGIVLDAYSKRIPIETRLNIGFMRSIDYPGSSIVVEKSLDPGSNYDRYIVSFASNGLKQFAYMTVPQRLESNEDFPVVIVVHGYQVPDLYTPDGNYILQMDAFAKNGYIVFKPDLRGHGKSQGLAESAYFTDGYTIDVLNAISSIKKYPDVNPEKIGIWAHSMGANIGLRASEISDDVKVLNLVSGVVGDYNDILRNWTDKVTYIPDRQDLELRFKGSQELISKFGQPIDNPFFWRILDPYYNVNLINCPVLIQVGLSDNQVPVEFSEKLHDRLIKNGKDSEIIKYPEANHDLDTHFVDAMNLSISFFDSKLK